MNVVVKKSQIRQGKEVLRFLEIVSNEDAERVEVRPGVTGYELKIDNKTYKIGQELRIIPALIKQAKKWDSEEDGTDFVLDTIKTLTCLLPYLERHISIFLILYFPLT
jgi:hypothetical protein